MSQKLFLGGIAMAIAIVVLGLAGEQVGYTLNSERAEFDGGFVMTEVEDEFRERRFLDLPTLGKVVTIGMDSPQPIYKPIDAVVDSRGDIYVLDWPENVVKRYDASGRPKGILGNGRGQGPGEFSEPSDLSVDQDGRVWVIDPALARITIFDGAGRLERMLKLDTSAMRVAHTPAGGFALLQPLGGNLIMRFNSAGEQEAVFGKVLRAQQKMGILLDGWLASDLADGSDGGLIFAGYRTGLLIGYDLEGNLRFARWAIGAKRELPRVVDLSGGHFRVERRSPFEALSLSVRGDRIFIMTPLKGVYGNKKGAVDSYHVDDGRYLGSYALPAPALKVYVTELGWLAVGEANVRFWRSAV